MVLFYHYVENELASELDSTLTNYTPTMRNKVSFLKKKCSK